MPSDRTFAAALDHYLPMTNENDVATELVKLLETARQTWESRVSVTTSMFDLIFTADARGPWDAAEELPAGAAWLKVRYQTRDQPAVLCFAFELYRREAHKTDPRRLHDFLVSGDVCRVENARAVLDAYLMQVATSD